MRTLSEKFSKLAEGCSNAVGGPASFCLALLVVVVWALIGPIFHFSDTWQLVINTGTTIVTFLMVFLIQHTQNKETKALHLKIDSLIISQKDVDSKFSFIEKMTEQEIDEVEKILKKKKNP